jgi:LmbE family N-acetylglucosaminyl deacetylase
MNTLRLLAILAHPDDESLGLGGTLAHYAAEGVETYVLTATRGEAGRYFDNESRPSDEEVGRARERELRAAAAELGVHDVALLDYRDKELDSADSAQVLAAITTHIRRIRPQVVVTFPPDGAYGHPDHIAISQYAVSAAVLAADASYTTVASPPHRVAKLYYFVTPPHVWVLYEQAFKRLSSVVDGEERIAEPWPDWMLTTRIDARAHWECVWRAVQRHETQMAVYDRLGELTAEQHRVLWGDQAFYRVYSTVNGGRAPEHDLFAGLR